MPESIASVSKRYNAVVIVTSDTCVKDESKDESGPHVVELLNETGLFLKVTRLITDDEMDNIVHCVEGAIRHDDPALIITIGGTGLCPRDVTPEATSLLYEKRCSGITAALHLASLRYVPHAALSRLTAGIVGGTLVVNFPGKLKACKDCFACLAIILEHALEQVRFDFEAYTATHRRQQLMDRTVPKQVTNLSTVARRTQLSASTNSLVSSMSNGHPARSAKIRPLTQKVPVRARSSSEVSRNKLTIQAIAESREEISNFERNQPDSLGSRRARATPTKTTIMPKKFYPKPAKQTPPAKGPQSTKPQPSTQLIQKPQPTAPPLSMQPFPANHHQVYPQVDYNDSLRILAEMSANLFKEPEDVILTSFGRAYNCVGGTLAEDLEPKRLVPPYAVSTMDGYVLNVDSPLRRAIDTVKTLPRVPVVTNLQEFERLQADTDLKRAFFCYQINTGGRLPRFNYAVIPVEKTTRIDEGSIEIHEIKQNQYVRRKGSDIGESDVIRSGTIIGSVEISSIIAMGHKKFKILPRPKICVMSTGDEVEDFFTNEFINQDSVVDMNSPLLSSLFRSQGYFVTTGGVARDDPNDTLTKINDNLKKCDVLLITGGASMGSKDYVKVAISHIGGQIHFGRVNIKPGKPVAFASVAVDGRRKFIFSLPGNPVSAFITSLVLVLPFLKHGAERYLQMPRAISEHLGEKVWAKVESLEDGTEQYRFDGRMEFVRAKIVSKEMEFIGAEASSVYRVRVSLRQQSSRLLNLVDCDCLIMIDPELRGKCLTQDHVYPAIKLDRKY